MFTQNALLRFGRLLCPYMGGLDTVALENPNPVQLTDWQLPVSGNFLGFSPKTKRVSNAQKQQLMDSGWQGVQALRPRPPK